MKFAPTKTIMIIFSIFMLIFGSAFICINARDLIRSVSTKDWLTTKGVVTTSEIHRIPQIHSSINQTYAPSVRYSYTVNNVSYSSNIIGFSHMVGGKETSQAIISRYPVDSEVVVYYSPSNPTDSVLDNSIQYKNNLMGVFFGLVFFVAGIVLYIFSKKKLIELRR